MPECLFCRMSSGETPVPMVAETDHAFAIRDISPRAPVHILIIPRTHIASAAAIRPTDGEVLANMFTLAQSVATSEGVADSGYRLAFNVGDDAGMTIHHLHMHLLGGRELAAEG